MLTPREAFKFGFLARCVHDGLSVTQMHGRIKTAADLLKKAGGPIDTPWDIAKTVAGYAIPAALIAPPVVGGLAGYGLARGTDINDTDVADIRHHELLDEYNRQTDRLKRQKAIRDYMRAKSTSGRVFL